MYHVICNLEPMFESLNDAVRYVKRRPELTPKIPRTAMPLEDRTLPRICLTPSVEGCMTAIGVLGMFRRCLNAHPDTKSYENADETYPVIICEFPDEIPGNPYVIPSEAQVPDVGLTNERWLMMPARPSKMELRWLDQYSLDIDTNAERTVCTGVKFVENPEKYHHPWLDGRGHPLDCSDMGGDIWPDNVAKTIFSQDALRFLYKDTCCQDAYVYPVPMSNCRVECHVVRHGPNGLVRTGETYIAFPSRLNAYTGFLDMHDRLVFDRDLVYLHGTDGSSESGCVANDGGSWVVRPFGKPAGTVSLHELASGARPDTLDRISLIDPAGREPIRPPETKP